MTHKTRIAMIGVGNVGGNLGVRLSKAGFPVRFGLRQGKDAGDLLTRAPEAEATSLVEAVEWAEVVVLAVPGMVAVEAAVALGDLADKVIIDCTNPLTWDHGPVWAPPVEGSNAAALAAALPKAKIVKGFNTFGAELHANPDLSAGPVDVQFATDHDDAKALASTLAQEVGFHPIDAGPLRNAALLENVAVLWIHLTTVGGLSRNSGFKLLAR